jgi:pantoate--beta-alanine ligase
LQSLPDIAVFGEKDYQQLMVITRMVEDLNIPVTIVAGDTVRDPDGLAMSSRNAYLSPAERAIAPTLYRVLIRSADQIRTVSPIEEVLSEAREAIKQAGFTLDYLEARHPETLQPLHESYAGPMRLLVAAKFGTTRLIDNIAV